MALRLQSTFFLFSSLQSNEMKFKDPLPHNIILLTTFLISSFLACNTTQHAIHNNRTEVAKIAQAIAEGGQVESETIGNAGEKSEQWERFETLCKTASRDELSTLTDHNNPVVRCYAFRALARRKDSAVFSILLAHLHDTAKVTIQSGCIVRSQIIADYLIDIVTPEYIDREAYKLKRRERNKLNSLMLYDKNIVLAKKNDLLTDMKPRAQYYNRVREIILTEQSDVSILALSRYKNENDIGIINTALEKKKDLYYPVYAAREFPSVTFYPRLVQIFEQGWEKGEYYPQLWGILYQALAQYPNSQTLTLFERTIQEEDTSSRQMLKVYLLVAIKKYPNAAFSQLENKMKLNDHYREVAADLMKLKK